MSAVPETQQEPMLLRSDVDGVCNLTLNRPGQFNALSQAMLEALLAELVANPGSEGLRRLLAVRFEHLLLGFHKI